VKDIPSAFDYRIEIKKPTNQRLAGLKKFSAPPVGLEPTTL
jgi:hypothetical protein